MTGAQLDRPRKGSGSAQTREDVVDAVIRRYNRDYALLLLGDHPVVMLEAKGPDGRDEVRFLTTAGFKEWNRPDIVWWGEADTLTRAEAAKLWLAHERRRQYNGLVFDPARRAPASYYNLWRGFSVQPSSDASGEGCARFLAHLHDNVCSGDKELFFWVVGWFASLFQQPTEKLGTSLVLRGTQGTGKTIVGRLIGSLLGPHYALVADSRFIVGRFNSHLANCLLLQLDEATWGGNHDAAGKLKDLVTGEFQFIEYKGREPVKVKNYVRLLVTGNNSWLVPAGMEERRFAVLDVGESSRQNHEYFQAIEDEFHAGGAEALLAFLLQFDLSRVNLRRVPATAALHEQKLSSMDAEPSWWLDILTRGWLPGDLLGEGQTEVGALYHDYIGQLERMGQRRKMNETRFGIELRKMAPGLTKHRKQLITPGGNCRPYVYEFPALGECRRRFGGDWSEAQLEEHWQEAPK
jgi:phage/plasmid-associated DNA primase